MQQVTSTDIKLALAEKHDKDFFLTECKSGSTWLTPVGDMKILDGLAIRKSWASPCFTGYEVKVSRGDFLRDAKFYTYEELVNCLYIVCPKDLIDRTELPESVGLIYYNPETKKLQTKKKAIFRKIEYSPDLLLYIIYSRLDSDRYPFCSDRKEYLQKYVENKMDSRELSHAVKSRLIQENTELIQKLERLTAFEEDFQKYLTIRQVLEKHHIYGWHGKDLATELDQALSRKAPKDITYIREELESCVRRLRQVEAGADEANL